MSSVIPRVKREISRTGRLDVTEGIRLGCNVFDRSAISVFAERIKTRGVRFFLNEVENKAISGQKYEEADVVKLCISRKETLAEEEYKLCVDESGIHVTAAAEQGVIHALTTLYQLLRDKAFPYIEIEDRPKYGYRGLHIDCARHFFQVEELKKIIEENSLVKINRLHLHLSDDQGWRIEIEKYPGLYKQCGREYYTKADICEIVSYAKKRGIIIIPEIDMPGHTRAMTAAYPDLGCFGENVTLAVCGGIYPVILCPGKEETFDFIMDVLDEIVPLFEGAYFHIGGDEAPKQEWKKCPACQKRIKDEKLADENALQGYFSSRIAGYIKEKYNKEIICWNDSLESVDFLDGSETVQYWSLEHKKQLPEFLCKGGKMIYSDMFDLYYDYPAAMSPMKRSYTCKPVIAGVDYSGHKDMCGVEACTWTEYIDTPQKLEKRIFPRIYAMAENAWSGGSEENYNDFLARLYDFRQSFSKVFWGDSDPKGIRKLMEKLRYAKAMRAGMPKEIREQTVQSAAVSEEFMEMFRNKMIK